MNESVLGGTALPPQGKATPVSFSGWILPDLFPIEQPLPVLPPPPIPPPPGGDNCFLPPALRPDASSLLQAYITSPRAQPNPELTHHLLIRPSGSGSRPTRDRRTRASDHVLSMGATPPGQFWELGEGRGRSYILQWPFVAF